MHELIELIEEMLRAGVLQNYAIFGALAQMRYTEAVVTMDADILVAVESDSIAVLSPIYAFCKDRGICLKVRPFALALGLCSLSPPLIPCQWTQWSMQNRLISMACV